MTSKKTAIAFLALLVLGTGCASSQEHVEAPPPPPPVVAEPEPVAEPPRAEYEDTDPAAVTEFKPTLDPYGVWVDDPTYGTVWVPRSEVVGSDFAPYVTSGHWAVDDAERWVWVSDYDPTFGWVVFHYGRWVYIDGRGWAWIPGRRWSPAWVVWRVGDPGYDYVGWAPAPPYYYWHSGVVVWLDTYPPAPYVFCHTRYVFHEHVHGHLVDRASIGGVAAGTHPYGHGSGKHYLAHPQPGPTVTSGHIASGSWPAQRHAYDTKTLHTASPPRATAGGPLRGGSRSLGTTHGGSPGTAHGIAPSQGVPHGGHGTAAGGGRTSPPPATHGPPVSPSHGSPSHGSPSHAAPPARSGGHVAPSHGGGGGHVAPSHGGSGGSRSGGSSKPSGGGSRSGGGRGGRR